MYYIWRKYTRQGLLTIPLTQQNNRSDAEDKTNDDPKYLLQLLCRDETTLAVKISDQNITENGMANPNINEDSFDGRLFILSVQEEGAIYAPKIVYIVS